MLEKIPIVLNNKGISKELKDKVVLVSGAAGSIGSEIVRQILVFNPKKIIILDQAETPCNVMGAGKRIAEKYVQSLQLKDQLEKGSEATKFITTRFGNV